MLAIFTEMEKSTEEVGKVGAWARGSGCLSDNPKKSDATARLSRLQLRGQAEARDTDQEVTGVDEITQAETK